MKSRITLALLSFFAAFTLSSQNYTWMRGSALNGTITGNYGTQGVPGATNDPGSRHGAATWVDASGNLWMFGGEGHSSSASLSWLNDLWKYTVATNQWTWVGGSSGPNAVSVYGTQGTASPSNQPGAREFAVSWVDNAGMFWMFGGDGFASTNVFGRLADLWRYDPATNVWTWMKGPNVINQNGVYGTMGTPASTNFPGARYGSGTFTDGSGNLYLFGGRGFPASGPDWFLNDFWKYNITNNNWMWVSGSNLISQPGTYGTLGTPATTNTPGSKEFPCCWKDASGNFILGAGRGYASTTVTAGYNNDMWRYDPSANTWCWFNGSQNANPLGVYGTLGVPSATTSPGGRLSAAAWKDLSGNLYMFGGNGWSSVSQNLLNDLFKYNPNTNEWTWLKGSNVSLQPGIYGTMGVPAQANTPGARELNVFWTAPNGHFWLFGADGYDSTGTFKNNMNDLWRYIPPCSPDSITAVPASSVCSGSSATITAFNQYPSTVSWYSNPSGGSAISNGTAFTTAALTAVNGQSVYSFYAEANSCTVSPRAAITITAYPLPIITISGQSSGCAGNTATLTASGGATYSWNTGAVTTSISFTIPVNGITYNVTGTDARGCVNTATGSVASLPLPSISVTASPSLICKSYSTTLTATGAASYQWNTAQTGPSIVVTPLSTFHYTVTGTGANTCTNTAVQTVSVIICTGLQGYVEETDITLYPNPNNGQFTLYTSMPARNQIIICNSTGQEVYRCSFEGTTVDIQTGLAKGIYFYSIRNNNGRAKSGKLVVD